MQLVAKIIDVKLKFLAFIRHLKFGLNLLSRFVTVVRFFPSFFCRDASVIQVMRRLIICAYAAGIIDFLRRDPWPWGDSKFTVHTTEVLLSLRILHVSLASWAYTCADVQFSVSCCLCRVSVWRVSEKVLFRYAAFRSLLGSINIWKIGVWRV